MKNRYRLIRYDRRGRIYSLHNNETGQRESLETRDKAPATELIVAKNESGREQAVNLQKARVYLTASDPAVSTRTWQDTLDAVIEAEAPDSENCRRWETFYKEAAIQQLLGKVVLELRAEDLLKVLAEGGLSTDVFMRRLCNFCIGMNWLPWPILAKKLWPPVIRQPSPSNRAAGLKAAG
jgi:hypothetical protein